MALVLVMLKFDDCRRATWLLAEQLREKPDAVWTREVGVIERHPSGRLSIRGTFGGDFFADPDTGGSSADVGAGALTGPLVGALTGPAGAAVGGKIGSALGNLLGAATSQGGESVYALIRSALPRGTSALLLLADASLVDPMLADVGAAADRIIRHVVEPGPQHRLEALLSPGGPEVGVSPGR